MLKLSLLSDKLTKYLVAAIILVVPLYPKFPAIRIPGTFVSIRLEDFLLAAVLFVVLINLLPKWKEVFRERIERSMFIYLAVGATSLLSAILLTQTVVPHIGFLHWLRRIEYFVPFFLGTIYVWKNKGRDLEFFVKVFMVTFILLFVYGVGQRYFHWPVIITQNEEYSRGVALRWIPGSHINSTFAGHYDLATFLVLLTPIFVSLLFTLKGKLTRLSLLIVIFSSLWLLANSVSRISVVSFLISGSIALLLLKKYKEIAIFLAVSIIFFGFSTDLLVRYGRLFEVTKEKLLIKFIYQIPGSVYATEESSVRRINISTPKPTPIPIFEDRSTSIRLNVEWPRALRALFKNPLLGTGYSSITLATDNDYLRLLGEVGILGFIAFSLILLNLVRTILRVIPIPKNLNSIESAFLAGLAGGTIGIFTNAIFIDIFEASKFALIFWLLIGLAVGLVRKYKNEQTN